MPAPAIAAADMNLVRILFSLRSTEVLMALVSAPSSEHGAKHQRTSSASWRDRQLKERLHLHTAIG
jgi:hypothetical protein